MPAARRKEGHTPEEVEQGIYDNLEKLKQEPVPPEELQKVKNNFAAAEYRRLSSNFPILMHLIRNDGEGDWREINEAGPKIQAVTAADVQRVANKYFTKENRAVAIYTRKAGRQGESAMKNALRETSGNRVAQVGNLLFRRLVVGRAGISDTACGLPIRGIPTRRDQPALHHQSARSLSRLAAALTIGLAAIGCQIQTKPAAPAAASATVAAPYSTDGIPDRPEKLTYPPLVYEPPAPGQFRVPLKSGPVAYVVPDRELPLVNIVVYVRTGDYLEPAGKEGLADLTGYLLARGGTKSKTAEDLEERLAFLAAQLNSGIGDTQGSVSLNLLSKDLDEGLAILREVL